MFELGSYALGEYCTDSQHLFLTSCQKQIAVVDIIKYFRVVTELFLNTGMEKKTKIRSNIRGFSRRKRGNTLKFASNTGREI